MRNRNGFLLPLHLLQEQLSPAAVLSAACSSSSRGRMENEKLQWPGSPCAPPSTSPWGAGRGCGAWRIRSYSEIMLISGTYVELVCRKGNNDCSWGICRNFFLWVETNASTTSEPELWQLQPAWVTVSWRYCWLGIPLRGNSPRGTGGKPAVKERREENERSGVWFGTVCGWKYEDLEQRK